MDHLLSVITGESGHSFLDLLGYAMREYGEDVLNKRVDVCVVGDLTVYIDEQRKIKRLEIISRPVS